jgi:hypothetical protein
MGKIVKFPINAIGEGIDQDTEIGIIFDLSEKILDSIHDYWGDSLIVEDHFSTVTTNAMNNAIGEMIIYIAKRNGLSLKGAKDFLQKLANVNKKNFDKLWDEISYE